MSIHPRIVERFALLEGMTSFEQLRADPDLEARFHTFMQWRDAAPPPMVTTRDTTLPGPHGPVPVRVYGETSGGDPRPALVWHHGGAFVFGDLDMPEADRTAREVAHRADAVVVSVDYRLAVDGVHYPVPLDDCVAAVRWVRDQAAELGVDADRITVGGASAGANLATGAVLRLRDEDAWVPALLLGAYGVFHAIIPPAAPEELALLDAVPPVLRMPAASTEGVMSHHLGGPLSTATGYAVPAHADLRRLCPTLLLNAEYDDLRPSEQAFAGLLAAAGVDVRQVQVPGVLHGFLNLPPEIEPVGTAFALIATAVAGDRSTRPVKELTHA